MTTVEKAAISIALITMALGLNFPARAYAKDVGEPHIAISASEREVLKKQALEFKETHKGAEWVVVEKDQDKKIIRRLSGPIFLLQHRGVDWIYLPKRLDELVAPFLHQDTGLRLQYGTAISCLLIPWQDLQIYMEMSPIPPNAVDNIAKGSEHPERITAHPFMITRIEIRDLRYPGDNELKNLCSDTVEEDNQYYDYDEFTSLLERCVITYVSKHLTYPSILQQYAANPDIFVIKPALDDRARIESAMAEDIRYWDDFKTKQRLGKASPK